MDMEQLLVNKSFLLEKYPGKGGWTYAAIPDIAQDKNAPFGWVTVKGFIDDLEITHFKLMPMGNGRLFLPVKAGIRKKIGKSAGDWVKIILYPDNDPTPIPEEFLACLKDDPGAYKTFLTYTNGQQKEFIDWIYSAKTDKTKVERMVETLNKLVKKQKLRDKPF
jgi:hypothetical protein